MLYFLSVLIQAVPEIFICFNEIHVQRELWWISWSSWGRFHLVEFRVDNVEQ